MIDADENKWIIENYVNEGGPLDSFFEAYKVLRCPYCDFSYISFQNVAHNFCPNCGERMVFKKTTEET